MYYTRRFHHLCFLFYMSPSNVYVFRPISIVNLHLFIPFCIFNSFSFLYNPILFYSLLILLIKKILFLMNFAHLSFFIHFTFTCFHLYVFLTFIFIKTYIFFFFSPLLACVQLSYMDFLLQEVSNEHIIFCFSFKFVFCSKNAKMKTKQNKQNLKRFLKIPGNI